MKVLAVAAELLSGGARPAFLGIGLASADKHALMTLPIKSRGRLQRDIDVRRTITPDDLSNIQWHTDHEHFVTAEIFTAKLNEAINQHGFILFENAQVLVAIATLLHEHQYETEWLDNSWRCGIASDVYTAFDPINRASALYSNEAKNYGDS